LPKNFSAEVPKDVSASSPFAEYSSHYSFDDGAIHAERVLTIKKAKVEPAQWDEYRKFIKAISDDQRNYTVLLENSKAGAESSSNSSPQAAELIRRAMSELHERKNSAAAADLAQAEQVNPNQPGLWRARAFIASNSPRPEQAAAEFRKDVEAHPDIVEALEAYVAFLVHAHRIDEAIEAVQKGVEHHPENVSLATGAARLLIQQKRYDDALALLQKPLSLAPGNPGLSSERVEALLLTKRPKDRMDAIGEALKLRDSDADPLIRNDVAYALAESGQGIGLAEDLSKNALHDSEEQAAGASLSTLEDADLRRIQVIAAEWDTLGFVYLSQSFFESGSEKQQLLAKAGKYIEASWQLLQNADTAEHLAELYDKIGRRQSATEMWRFALALNPVSQKAKDHLRQAGVPEQITPSIQNPSSPERLVRARTFGIPMLPKQTATADFYVLLSSNGERDAQFISGTESLRSATDTVKSAVKFTFPDDGPEKIIRRGILSCSLYTTPNCQFTLLLPSDVHK
jgi:tetratricopeptide (TPR) repeat protein